MKIVVFYIDRSPSVSFFLFYSKKVGQTDHIMQNCQHEVLLVVEESRHIVVKIDHLLAMMATEIKVEKNGGARR